MGAAGFPLGRLCATRGVAHDMERDAAFARFVAGSLARYRCCDWGDVSAADGKANSRAVECGGERILASYRDMGHEGAEDMDSYRGRPERHHGSVSGGILAVEIMF